MKRKHIFILPSLPKTSFAKTGTDGQFSLPEYSLQSLRTARIWRRGILTIITIISSFFIFSSVAEAELISRECRNGETIHDTTCGPTCYTICDDRTFNAGNADVQNECKELAERVTDAWEKYRAERQTLDIYVMNQQSYSGISFGSFRIHFILLDQRCSIADKCHGTTCATDANNDGVPGSPYMRAGNCTCGGVGDIYKICCRDGRPVNATRAPDRFQDDYPPQEAHCPDGYMPPPHVLTCGGSPLPPGTLLPVLPGAGVPPGMPEASDCRDRADSVTASISATRTCLPFQPSPANNPPTASLQTNITWTGATPNRCGAIIGGGSPSNSNITCRNESDNWSFNQRGSGSISQTIMREPDETQDYSVICTRDPYICTDNDAGDYSSADACANSCNNVDDNLNVASCRCEPYCAQRYTAETNPTDWCAIWHRCWNNPAGEKCLPGSSGCERDRHEVCGCYERRCQTYRVRQEVVSRQICASTDDAEIQIRFIQKPGIPTNRLETNPLRTQILLNQFINLGWNITDPDSEVDTTLRCTPSVTRGDGTGWTGILTNLSPLNPTEMRRNLSPQRTTNYRLVCRNRDDLDARCYYDSEPAEREVRVFTPDLREVPAR